MTSAFHSSVIEDRVWWKGRCAHELFEAQAQKSPGATALRSRGEAATYQQLNGRANTVAWRLREMGAGPETLVGLALPLSIDAVAGLLGILKAGAGYVALDLSYPSERVTAVMKHAQLSMVVTDSRSADRVP